MDDIIFTASPAHHTPLGPWTVAVQEPVIIWPGRPLGQQEEDDECGEAGPRQKIVTVPLAAVLQIYR